MEDRQWLKRTPRNREVMGPIPAGCRDFFLILSSVLNQFPSGGEALLFFPIITN